MSFYTLGSEVHTTETYSKIADAINEEVAKMLVNTLNAKQQSVQESELWNCPNGDARAIKNTYTKCPICGTPRA